MLKKTYRIPDMQCPNCAMILEGIEDHLDGIKQISASYHKLQMVVEYDETRVSEEQIIAAVKKKGYQIVSA
jgi:copper chaperone CopZ